MCSLVSLADFFVVASEAVMGYLAPNFDSSNVYKEGSLAKRFRDQFVPGRTTALTCPFAEGRMPVATSGCKSSAGLPNTLSDVFVDNIYGGFTTEEAWRLTAAISGAHTLGSTSYENSGFFGTWSDLTNMGSFNNDYFRSIIFKGWSQENVLQPDRVSTVQQWGRTDIGKDTEHKEMMLHTDMCLAYDIESRI